jgi:hypothetical protein
MSYIDTFDHKYVGLFAGLPIYYSRLTVAGTGGTDFSCGPGNLVLGGGGGEHPALVFHRLDCLAMHFVLHAVNENDKDDRPVNDQFRDFPIWDYLDVPFAELFDFAGWSVRHYHGFYERCRSVAVVRPFGVDDYLSFEDWLAVCIGELVWFSFSELIENLTSVRAIYPSLRPIANNVTIPPPGYPECYGRSQNEHGVVWGDHYFTQTTQRLAEQAGTGKPATRPVLEPEGGDKPQTEAEGRSQ